MAVDCVETAYHPPVGTMLKFYRRDLLVLVAVAAGFGLLFVAFCLFAFALSVVASVVAFELGFLQLFESFFAGRAWGCCFSLSLKFTAFYGLRCLTVERLAIAVEVNYLASVVSAKVFHKYHLVGRHNLLGLALLAAIVLLLYVLSCAHNRAAQCNGTNQCHYKTLFHNRFIIIVSFVDGKYNTNKVKTHCAMPNFMIYKHLEGAAKVLSLWYE